MNWDKLKDNIRFSITVCLFLWPIGAATLYAYHQLILFPLLEREYGPLIEQKIADAQTEDLGMDKVENRIRDYTKAALHTALLADANHLLASYRAIPDKKPHQVQRMEEIMDDKTFHQKYYEEAEKQGLILPVFPPP